MDTPQVDPAQQCVPTIGMDVPQHPVVEPTAPPQPARNQTHRDHDSRHVQSVVDRNAQLTTDRNGRIDVDLGLDPLNRSLAPVGTDKHVLIELAHRDEVPVSATTAPKVRALARFSFRGLQKDLTILQDRVRSDAAAHGYRPTPGRVARRAVTRKRERAISEELRHRRRTSPTPPSVEHLMTGEDEDDIATASTLRDRGPTSTRAPR